MLTAKYSLILESSYASGDEMMWSFFFEVPSSSHFAVFIKEILLEMLVVRLKSLIRLLQYFLFYIAAGLKGIGGLLNILFGLSTVYGVVLAALIISAYVILGGFIAVTTADAFQGMFLLLSISGM